MVNINLLSIAMLALVGAAAISCNSYVSANVEPANGSESQRVGGPCDGCNIMYVGMPQYIDAIDTSDGWYEEQQKICITGKVYKLDGRTPAPNIIIYYWHTNSQGLYTSSTSMDTKAARHGHIRGWMKTDSTGTYSLYTSKPGPYPNDKVPAHIHMLIKEPQLAHEYYIDDLLFDNDKLITSKVRHSMQNRGGTGLLRLLQGEGYTIAEHHIIAGLNIPFYPQLDTATVRSGLSVGEECPSFIPYHAYGVDKGSRACPVCKYGRYHGIIYFVGNNPHWDEIKNWLRFFENESTIRNKKLKVYFVYGNESGYQKEKRQLELEKIGNELHLVNVALTFVPSLADTESEVNLYHLNADVDNTIIVYKHRSIIGKFVNLRADVSNYKRIQTLIDESQSTFDSLAPAHE